MKFKIMQLIKASGPGIITGAADDDPSGIGTYTVAGAQFGTAFLWTAVVTWPLMAVVQMACARIGMVTGQGLGSALKNKFPKWVVIIFGSALFFANTLNVGADLSAMADSAEMLTGGSSHFFVVLFATGITLATVHLSYTKISQVLKWLAISLFSYIATALILSPDWKSIFLSTIHPHWPQSSKEWATLVAILGTTISPYLFFWQASLEVEEEKALGLKTVAQRRGATEEDLFFRKFDVGIGTFFSNLVMYFVILAAALTLNKNGLTNIETSKQAAEALVPIAGKFASLLYTLGILGVGLLAIPTLTGSAAYALAETFNWSQGLDLKLKKAKLFYAVVFVSTLIAVIFDFIKLNPIKALYWSAVINGLLAPFLLIGILYVLCDSKLMRDQAGTLRSKIGIAITTLLMIAAALGMFLA